MDKVTVFLKVYLSSAIDHVLVSIDNLSHVDEVIARIDYGLSHGCMVKLGKHWFNPENIVAVEVYD